MRGVVERGTWQCWGKAEHRMGMLGGRGPYKTIALSGGQIRGWAANGREQLEPVQAMGAGQQVLGEHRHPFVLGGVGRGVSNRAGGCWTLLVFRSETQAWLPVSGEGAGAAILSGLSCAASLRVEGFSLLLGFPKTADCTKAPLQRRC